jgi:hypothetical protein
MHSEALELRQEVFNILSRYTMPVVSLQDLQEIDQAIRESLGNAETTGYRIGVEDGANACKRTGCPK